MTISYVSAPNKRTAISQTFNPVNYEGVTSYADPYANYTTLLLKGNGTNGVINNNFQDSSSNSFAITRNGNTTQGSFSPYGTNWSNYFDGSGDYLTAPNSDAIAFGSGDLTIECWCYSLVTTGGTDQIILGKYTGSFGSSSFGISHNNTTLSATFYTGGTSYFTMTSSVALQGRVWNHIAVTRSGNSWYMFLNGAQVASTTQSVTIISNTTALYVGGEPFYNQMFTGYISNLRIVKGTAVYTAAFTPPSAPLTAITNTSILTCADNRFMDDSANAFAITVYGNTSVHRFSPFAPSTPYITSANGGSGYFDGSGDYLSTPGGTAFNFGSGNFTIEAWVYRTTDGGFTVIADSQYWYAFSLRVNSSGAVFSYGFDSNTNSQVWYCISANSTIPVSAWCHLALVRNGSSIVIYANGVSVASTTASGSAGTTSSIRIAHNDAGVEGTGYVSDARIIKGTAQYTTTFTPPTAPLTAVSGTSLLLSFINAGIYDDTSMNVFETVGNTNVSTSTKKYGTGSIYFDGNGDYLLARSNEVFNFGTGDFTVEFWVNASASGSYTQNIGTLVSGTEAGTWRIGTRYNSANTVYFARGTGSGFNEFTAAVNVNDGLWHHVAVTRLSGVVYIYIDGLQRASSSISGTCTSTNPLYIGYNGRDSAYVTGYMDDIRITKGIARYTTNFIPPQDELPFYGAVKTYTSADTVDLGGVDLPLYRYTTMLLQGDGTNGTQNNTFIDSSANNYSMTRNGNSSQGTFSPYGTNWSNYFDGSSSYMYTASSTGLGFGTGDFTVEFFIFPTVTPNTWSIYHGSTANSFIINTTSSGNLIIRQYGVTDLFTSASPLVINTWNHVAVARSGTTISLWLNGSLANGVTGSNSTNFASSSAAYIGRADTATAIVTGWISNLRVVKGTAVYNPAQALITVPTSPLTAISGTSLLTCQSNRFIDSSSNALAITRSGTPSVQRFSPFAPTSAYSSGTNGGSGYFDGTGDYLTTAATSNFNVTGDFTLEGWFYLTAAANNTFFTVGTPRVNFNWGMAINSDGTITFMSNPSNNWDISGIYTSTATVPLRAWTHVAAVKNGSNFSMYINGVSVYSTNSFSQPTAASGTIYVATYYANTNNDGSFVNGYMTDLRLVKGTAVYTTAFTPPTAPLTAIANTTLLLSFQNSGVLDNAMMNDFETVGNAQISTSVKKYGTGSMYFDGTGDGLQAIGTPNTVLGTGDFTVEFWVYLNANTGSYKKFVELGTSGSCFTIETQASNNILNVTDLNNSVLLTAGTALALTTWTHVAVTRTGGTMRIFQNGILVGSGADSTNFANSGSVYIGQSSSGQAVNAYMDDLRITKGFARYTMNFVPPTATLPTA